LVFHLILARDQAVLNTLFFSGDRCSDLLRRFPSDDGFHFNHIRGKTLRDGSSNIFEIPRHPNSLICQVTAMENCVAIGDELAIDLSKGYLFRATTPHGNAIDKPLLSSTAQQRLKLYLDEGKTLHTLRSGHAITLAFSGAPLVDVTSHIGWKNGQPLYTT